MPEPTLIYHLDKFDLGDESDHIDIDRMALHEQEVSPQIATVILLKQIEQHLSDISKLMHESRDGNI